MAFNVAEVFRQQTIKWNNEGKCGFCWEFDLPLRDSDVEESKLKTPQECCVSVLITNLSIQDNIVRDSVTTLITSYKPTYQFTLNLVIPDIIDRMTYNEQDYPISQSKWETILQPLRECLKGDEPFDFCDIVGVDIPVQLTAWNTKLDWTSENYTGWAISVTLTTDGDHDYVIIPQ